MFGDQNDVELVARLVRGDNKAFEVIYLRYVDELYAYARKNITASEECEEVIHDVFEEIWAKRESLSFVTALKGYLYRLLRFRIIKHFRQHSKVKRYAEYFRLVEALYDTIAETEEDDIQLRITKSLSQLPERCQEAVKLRLQENLSNDDIAVKMNIKKSTVENYMVTALAHLRSTVKIT